MSTPYYAASGNEQQQQQHQQPVLVQGRVVGGPGHGRRGGGQQHPYQKYNMSERSSGGFANALSSMNFNSSLQRIDSGDAVNNNDPSSATSFNLHKPYAQQQQELQEQAQNPRGCRDVAFAILFYAHVGAMIYCAAVYAPQMALDMASGADSYVNNNDGGERRRRLVVSSVLRFLDEQQQQEEEEYNENSNENNGEDDDDEINIDPHALLLILCFSGALGFCLSSLGLGFMIHFAETLIKVALWFNIILFGILALLSLATGALPATLMLLMFCGMAAYYAYFVWARIPFAASNLVTAVTAVRANMGLAVYAYWSVVVLFLWSILWFISTSSTIYVLSGCNAADGDCDGDINGFLLFLFILSFYWTSQVISNVVHVTTAGTVGTWWYHPEEATGCCSKAVRQSYIRALTTSFGSICLGSLIVALVQALKEMVRQAQEGEDSMLACIAVCLLGCLESLIEYFNKWAFVYVGLYGFSFMEAGSNVMSLFRARGWTAIIADLMVDTVLSMVSLGVGLLTAIVAVMICASAMGVGDAATLAASFGIGFAVGYAICATLFSIVSSAVNTVVVCYAEAPNEFQQHYPELSTRMRDSWRQAWPNDFAY